ncbi:hypothetical protein Tco_0093623 [Tanacetum coccineum]
MTRSSTKELLSPFENLEQKFCSKMRLFDTPSLVESNSPELNHNFDIEEQLEEEVRETMMETIEQYMSKTRENYGSGVTRITINQDTPFELKGQFLKELYDNTFSGSKCEDANEHIEKVLEIVDLFYIPKVTQDQIMLRAFPVSLTEAAKLAKRHEENSNIIKEIRASIDAAIRNQGASIKTLEIQIGQMRKVLIRRIGCGQYAISGTQHRSILSETVPFLGRL